MSMIQSKFKHGSVHWILIKVLGGGKETTSKTHPGLMIIILKNQKQP